MFKLLKTVFKAGDVTTKYPFKPYEVDDDFRGKPELNSDQCIVCAAGVGGQPGIYTSTGTIWSEPPHTQ